MPHKDLGFRNLVSTTHTAFQSMAKQSPVSPFLVQGRCTTPFVNACFMLTQKINHYQKMMPFIQSHLCPEISEQCWQLVNKDVWALFSWHNDIWMSWLPSHVGWSRPHMGNLIITPSRPPYTPVASSAYQSFLLNQAFFPTGISHSKQAILQFCFLALVTDTCE